MSEVDTTSSPAQTQGNEKKDWEADEKVPDCSKCQAHFTMIKRRHRCRMCAKIYCKACSSKRYNGQRVCDGCHHVAVEVDIDTHSFEDD